MKKNPLPPTSFQWDQFEKLTAENNELIEMLLENKELKAIYSRVRNSALRFHARPHKLTLEVNCRGNFSDFSALGT